MHVAVILLGMGECPGQVTGPLQQTAAWDSLDRARELHLAGEEDRALRMLENIALDTTITDTQLQEARRELTAFVLYSGKEFQKAFDSLRVFSDRKLERVYQEADRTSKATEREIDSLSASIEEHKLRLLQLEERYYAEQERKQLILAVSIAVLLLIILFLAFKLKRTPPNSPLVAETSQAIAVAAPPADRKGEAIPVGSSPNTGFIHAHLSLIGDRLNKAHTVEAAVHVGALTRLVKLLDEVPADDLLPAQQAIALLRQYLKLEALRSADRLRYEVEADREVLDRDIPLPIHRLMLLLAKVIDRTAKQKDVIQVRATLSTDRDRPSLVVKFSSDRNLDAEAFVVDGSRVEHSTDGDREVLTVQW